MVSGVYRRHPAVIVHDGQDHRIRLLADQQSLGHRQDGAGIDDDDVVFGLEAA